MLFVLKQDGRPIQRGITTYQEAWAIANRKEKDYLRHRDNDKRRVPEFSVAMDEQYLAQTNDNYRRYKEGERITWQD